MGGDTDTNACIVGGMMGAAVGVNNIPYSMITTLVTCDTRKGRSRPTLLQSHHALDIVRELLE